MPKPPSTWKSLERFIPEFLKDIWPGGERTHWAPEDCRVGSLSIEVKHGQAADKCLSKGLINAWNQATVNAKLSSNDEIERLPALVIHKKYQPRENAIILMSLKAFRHCILSLMDKEPDTTTTSPEST